MSLAAGLQLKIKDIVMNKIA